MKKKLHIQDRHNNLRACLRTALKNIKLFIEIRHSKLGF